MSFVEVKVDDILSTTTIATTNDIVKFKDKMHDIMFQIA